MTVILNAGILIAFLGILVGAALIMVGLGRILGMLKVHELDDDVGGPPGEDYRSVLLWMPDWMLKDLRARAGRRGVSVVELIRRDISVCRRLESQGVDPWGVYQAAVSRVDESADESPEQP